jgi:dihydroorotate dehydrogenase/NAD-dependent dihydropyrimidine dehydrogenase PreA subunit
MNSTKGIEVTYAGIELKNPVVAVAGPLGRTYQSLTRSIEAGASMVMLKSCLATSPVPVQPKPSAHVYPKPAHMFLGKYGLPKMMYNWEGVPAEFTAEKQADMINAIKPLANKSGCRIAANINLDEYYMKNVDVLRRDIQILLKASPDILEICPCPYHFDPEMFSSEVLSLNSGILAMLREAYKVVLNESNIPVVAKAGGQVFIPLAQDLIKVGIKYLHVTEAPLVYGTIVDIEKMEPRIPGPAVITYGILRRPLVNLAVAQVTNSGPFELISSSGVWTADDTVERMMCGATLVGLHTAIQYHGHKLFTQIIDGVGKFLERKGLTCEEIRGKAVPMIVSQEAHDNWIREHDIPNEAIRPVVDMDKCTECGMCAHCIHGAIDLKNKKPVLNLDNCVRCGICESLCVADAITMQRT